MQERRSQVNFRKLVGDLADMYPDDPFDVVIAELVANSLDAKAKNIAVAWDDDSKMLVVADDGNGMVADQFTEYHDFAAELKARGSGIGFAGVGAKVSFNIASRVVTETRNNGVSSASDWRWHDDGSLIWDHISSDKLVANGTRVEVHFNHDQVPSGVNDEYLIGVLKRHYLPLFITEFARSYIESRLYPVLPQFKINGSPIPQDDLKTAAELSQRENFKIQSGGRGVGWGAIGISERNFPVGGNAYGVLLCTYGKVIKSELFGQSTGMLGAKLFGIVEVPHLIKYLTTNKSDLKGGPGRNRELNALLDPIRERLRKFLVNHGVTLTEQSRNRLSEKLERELIKMVPRLPELQDFEGLLHESRKLRKSDSDNKLTSKGGQGDSRKSNKTSKTQTKRQQPRRKRKSGPRVAFESHSSRGETAWIDSNTVVINSGHEAYCNRATQDQARLTYCMFAIGVALDKAELVQPADGGSYVDKFIAAWGKL